ncbi:hypothetical protein, partial [Thiolapillus sp.]
MAHFLGGRLVRVVWCEFKSESGHWKKAHLLLRLFDVSYGFQYGTRRAGNHVDHSYKSSVVSIASGSCSGC